MTRPETLVDRQAWMRARRAPEAHALGESPDFCCRHYSVQQVADMWGMSTDAVRRLFEHEPGVLVFGGNGSRGKRQYTTVRIPEGVLGRVYRKHLRR